MCTCDLEDTCDFSTTDTMKARKPHRCYECGDAIQPGDRYVRVAGKWEGDFATFTRCLTCSAWMQALFAAQKHACGCSGVEFGGLWSSIREFTEEHLGYHPETGEGEMRPPEKYVSEWEMARARRSDTVVMGGSHV